MPVTYTGQSTDQYRSLACSCALADRYLLLSAKSPLSKGPRLLLMQKSLSLERIADGDIEG